MDVTKLQDVAGQGQQLPHLNPSHPSSADDLSNPARATHGSGLISFDRFPPIKGLGFRAHSLEPTRSRDR